MTTMIVPDIAHPYQDGFDVDGFADGGGQFIIIKASEGGGYRNPAMPAWRDRAHARGLFVGLSENMVRRFVLWLDEDENGCWLWTRGCTTNGYGHGRMDSQHFYAHRLAWELWHGPIPDGLELDHLCRVHRCCNPDHLEPVTHAENMRRSTPGGAAGLNRAQTECKKGHPFDGHDGRQRTCSACIRGRSRARSRQSRTGIA